MRTKILAAIAAFGLSTSTASTEEDRTAWIAVDQESEAITLRVFAALNVGETGRFQLISRKSGNSGSATSQQSGRIGSGDGNVAGPFSTSRFSLLAGEALEAELIITTSSGRTLTDRIIAAAE